MNLVENIQKSLNVKEVITCGFFDIELLIKLAEAVTGCRGYAVLMVKKNLKRLSVTAM